MEELNPQNLGIIGMVMVLVIVPLMKIFSTNMAKGHETTARTQEMLEKHLTNHADHELQALNELSNGVKGIAAVLDRLDRRFDRVEDHLRIS